MSVSSELLCSFELLKPLDSSALKSHIKKGRNKRNSMLNSPPVSASVGAKLRTPPSSSSRVPVSPSPDRAPVSPKTDAMALHGGPRKTSIFDGYDDLEEPPSTETTKTNLSLGVRSSTECLRGKAKQQSSETSVKSSAISFTMEHDTKSPDETRVRKTTDEELKARRLSSSEYI